MRKSLQISLLAVAGVAFLSMTDAQAGAFVGASLGQASQTVTNEFDASDTAYKVQGGYRFMKYFALEGDYRDCGTARDDVAGFQTSLSALDMFAVGVLPIGSGKWELFGKLGASSWSLDADDNAGTWSESYDGTDMAMGLGVSYQMKKSAFRMEYEKVDASVDVDDVSSDMFSAGFDWRF